ncbi:MAG: glycerol-3-phosphate 1-O-acyltransferase PlsY [Candidatus Rokubacteria bacterium]|nr:glycerol-3-phosphate 1-O-acyltransferase PlsY [Candidatus Rokubacteria bacterium]
MSLAGLVLVYLVGAVPVGYLVARVLRVDIRTHGSGNIGATNVLRTLGKGPAAITLLLDAAKGYTAAWIALALGPEPWWGGVGAVLAVTGNCWSVFLGFRGGKGMATSLGAFVYLMPLAVLPAILVWVAVAATLRYVSLASLAAALCVPIGAALLRRYHWSSALAGLAVALIIALRHRDNVARLLSGTERKLGERVSTS